MTEAIVTFAGEHRWLSNFWPARVVLEGIAYASVEHAFQAAKTVLAAERHAFVSCTAGQAKRLGRTVTMRPDWEAVKLEVMASLLAQKFAPGTQLAARLAATGDALLIEGNTWGDTFWGTCRGRGHNHLGRLLMDQRAALHASRSASCHAFA